jgi:hypothetical protein
MSRGMLSAGRDRVLREARGPLKQFRAMLEGPSGAGVLASFKRFLRREYPWPKASAHTTGLLKRIVTVTVSGVKKFVAVDHIKAANVSYMGNDFKNFFLAKVEENVPEAKLVVSRLEGDALDAPILTALGDKAVVKLAHLFGLLNKQSKGEDGVLLTNGDMNIFYVCGPDHNLWTVFVCWHRHVTGWYILATPASNPGGWSNDLSNNDFQLFSRDS